MTNTQVNPGGGGSACIVSLGNYTGTGGVQEIFDFQSVHFENSAAAYTGSSTNRGIFCSDSTVSYIRELNVSGSQFNNSGGEPLFVLNSATAQEMWDFEGSYFICSATNLTLNPISGGAQPAYKNTFKNNSFCGASTITGDASQYLESGGNNYGATTLTGAFAGASFDGDIMSSLSDTATGPISCSGPSCKISFTPTLTFGGSSTGITTSTAIGTAWRTSEGGFGAQTNMQLTSVGSATGNAVFGGLPYSCSGVQMGSVPWILTGMQSLTSPVTLENDASTDIVPYETGATGNTQLTNSNFTSSSHIQGLVRCARRTELRLSSTLSTNEA